MAKGCKERRAGRGSPRSSGLTQQDAGQLAEAQAFRSGQRSFVHLLRCMPLNMGAYPAALRLADERIPAAHCGKIIESGP